MARTAATPSREPPAQFRDFDLAMDDAPPPRAALPQTRHPHAKTVLGAAREPAPVLRGGDPLESMTDRRKASRSVARVPARLQATHVNLEGRTRDLSETGALISADASVLPLGKVVELEIQHPESGERIAVRGKVSRHVETDGTVAAVGVHFDPPPERASELRNFVSDVKRAESERARSGIAGRIEELGIANLVQMVGQASPLGTLTATHGAEEATIAFENGALRYALLRQVISGALVEVVHRLPQPPRYLVAKGGITASDVATQALGMRSALVLGPILPGVPVWEMGPETLWPGLRLVVFPGNVGAPDALARLLQAFDRRPEEPNPAWNRKPSQV